jgi:hypothetical protein
MKFEDYMKKLGKLNLRYSEGVEYRVFEAFQMTVSIVISHMPCSKTDEQQQDGNHLVSWQTVKSDQLEGWVQDLELKPTHDAVCGLRLLICPWTSSESSTLFPFANEEVFDRVSAVFSLPSSYPLAFARRQGIPVSILQGVDQRHIGKICSLSQITSLRYRNDMPDSRS